MIREWQIIENSGPGLNRISLEIEPTKEQLKSYPGYKHWINVGNKEQLRGIFNDNLITNLDYLEGLYILKQFELSLNATNK